MFIGILRRSSVKPACISAEIARAMARASGSLGHSLASGKSSARVSMIASVSQTVRSPWSNTGTRPEGENLRICSRLSGWPRGMTVSSNSAPVFLRTSQARSDQDE